MFLKSIEIHGFKSFANKTVFQFQNGITGIVGPNGSGKSNVADAVRWVLGEQSVKQLRGGVMQDVIFSGTELRKPLSYAYVAITLDNSDHSLATSYDEVTVARRLYRSGESEYLLNGSACRLKDINELFYDTGIGKEGYSIIGQGQIDKILSGKPEERRELFDEAAGIVKFKRRKVAAQKKLESEENNLVRVKDILSELERQIGPLEKQSEKAKIYLKHKEDLKTLDVNSFLLENKKLQEVLSETEDKLKLANDNLAEITASYDSAKAEYDEIQGEISELENLIEETRSTLANTDITRTRLENEISLLEEQIRSSSESEALYKDRADNLAVEIANKEKEKEDFLLDQISEDEKAAQIQQKAEELRNALDLVQNEIAELNNAIESGKTVIINELNNRASIKAQIGRCDSGLEQIAIRKAELNSRLLRAKTDEAQREDVISSYEAVFERATAELRELTQKEIDVEKEISSFRGRLSDADQELRDAQGRFHQEKSRLQALVDIAERYEGYGGSVKKVMEQKDNNPGIIGVVADIIKVDKKYETAIETALGGNIQNIVTRDEKTAKNMISFLKEGKLGRATFLPMDSVREPQKLKAIEVLDEVGVLGLAHQLVKTDSEFADIAESLLGRFVVVDDVEHATKIARKYHYTIRMVTLEGELLQPGGAISGGAFKNNTNFLGKRREISDLERSISNLEKIIEDRNALIDSIRENRNVKRTELEHIKLDIQNKTIEQNTARLNLTSARERMEEETVNAQSLKAEAELIEKQILETNEEKEKALASLEKSEQIELETNQKIAIYQKTLETTRAKESEASEAVSSFEIEVSKMNQARSFKQANVDRIDGEIARAKIEYEQIQLNIEAGRENVRQKTENIESIKATIEASFADQDNKQTMLKEYLGKKEALSGKQKNFFDNRESLSKQMSQLDKEVYRLSSQKERFEESIERQINYMWDEYEITLTDAAAIRDESLTDLTVMKRDIAELKDKIKRLGDVNVNAIEEFREVSERYETMKTQHDDLVTAAQTLANIIEELDDAMRKQFQEKFSQIESEFDKVFKELFGGGKGSLELTEGEDILEAGIKIIAQPPGKKLQNMMQLSGGEKALSAIALLFAIQNLKPSPFCLLDEIEAALDDANVSRFAKYLHKLTKNTQFIVITHRRGTMEQVDQLYGITMQEKGVSIQVSVNLIDKELDD